MHLPPACTHSATAPTHTQCCTCSPGTHVCPNAATLALHPPCQGPLPTLMLHPLPHNTHPDTVHTLTGTHIQNPLQTPPAWEQVEHLGPSIPWVTLPRGPSIL
ncbi:hypothetical protein KIL84_000428 [Mauremys mutica]|uniref:Uncharacterized protein n=1 Tax=Mauremys mutica TaxID=74926 RepID=A0A9D4AWL2_9SAUR|nr:hypothetical protein KIL84_000428 [Mauremys mutica]